MMLVRASRFALNLIRNVNRTSPYSSVRLAAERSLKPGEQLFGYTVEKVVPVPEFSITAFYLRHKTGAQHLHVARQDSDNVFGVAFRTTPRDSTGVPHILEHLSLCGSERYPVRDPFFKMYTRSLSTFMNAFTASDWTMYPFSTQNAQDYENLMSVYLDAAFFPKLRKLDFNQEGWRLEHEDPTDKNSPIVFKGVVFNEMKGAFSNPQQLFSEINQNLLLPSHTYGIVSGGDPVHIPDLTWEELKAFHTKHYHPSNSRFYTYGNFPLDQHLELINKLVLEKFEKITVDTSVTLEPRWSSPREAHITCPPDPMSPDPEKNTTIAISFLLKDITDINEACTLSILGNLLVDGEKSPFYQSLLESNIGSDYSPVIGYNGYTKESSFAVGLQRVDKKDIQKVKDIVDATFDSVIKNGFDHKRIEAILHKIELSQKHQSDKFGLNLGIGLLPAWTHDGDPIQLLQVNRQVDHFKQQLKDNPNYLQDVVKKYFKNNPHKLTLIMSPDEQFDKNRQELEIKKLESKRNSLSEKNKIEIYEDGLELAKIQSLTEDVSCLPTVKVSDIDRQPKTVKTSIIKAHDTPVQLCVQPTNGVVYFRAISNIAGLPSHLKQFVPLFCNVVTKMGAGKLDYKDQSEKMEMKTGGLDASVHINEFCENTKLFEESILFSSYCLDQNIAEMFDLWTDIFTSLSLSDMSRLQVLLMMSAADMSNGLSDHAHRYAMMRAGSRLVPSYASLELMSGVSQVNFMKSLAKSSDIDVVVQSLKDIASHVLSADNLRASVNSTQNSLDGACGHVERFVSGLVHRPMSGDASNTVHRYFQEDANFRQQPEQVHFQFPFQVNFIAKSIPTVPYTHPDSAPLNILGKLLTTRFLHREIREKGGAYGGGAEGTKSLFHFYSYRDPNLQKTLETFSQSVAWAVGGSFTEQDIDEAKLSVFQRVDSPITPGMKGMRQFLNGIDDDTFSQHRMQLLDTRRDDLVRVASEYLLKNLNSVAVFGPHNDATEKSDNWNIVKEE